MRVKRASLHIVDSIFVEAKIQLRHILGFSTIVVQGHILQRTSQKNDTDDAFQLATPKF